MNNISNNYTSDQKFKNPTWVFEFNEEGRPVPVLVEEQTEEQEIIIPIDEVEVLPPSFSLLDHPYLPHITIVWKGFFYIFLPVFIGYLFVQSIPSLKLGFDSAMFGIGKAFAVLAAIGISIWIAKDYFLPYLRSNKKTPPRYNATHQKSKQKFEQSTSRQSFNIHVDIDINN